MTNPAGKSFLSYKRSHKSELEMIINAQREAGIPTWQDISDLANEPTEASLISTIKNNSLISNAIIWVTPDIAESTYIQTIEIPEIYKRFNANDGFFVIPVAAGGLGYKEASVLASKNLGIDDFTDWNWEKIESKELTASEAKRLAIIILKRRVENLHVYLPLDEPIRISVNTVTGGNISPNTHLVMDWTHRFDGKIMKVIAWDQDLFPALKSLAKVLEEKAPRRLIEFSGKCSLPIAFALGSVFLRPRGIPIFWNQMFSPLNSEIWGLDIEHKRIDFAVETKTQAVESEDIALLISITNDVEQAVKRSFNQDERLPFRVILRVKNISPHLSAEEAVNLAINIVEATKLARTNHRVNGHLHIFMAGPVGLAIMIGQLLNTFGQVHLYDHVASGNIGDYKQAITLTPSNI